MDVLAAHLRAFREFGTLTHCDRIEQDSRSVPLFVNEFWTAKQRAANAIHEISYRACFKPQLPAFFIDLLTEPGDIVYDPFMGRGTTVIEAALRGRVGCGGDINPLSVVVIEPRLDPPELEEIEQRLNEIDLDKATEIPEELLVFYHPETLKALCSLKNYLLARQAEGTLDRVDKWIRMVALNRLTGHSNGFFSVYTLPPNQATSVKAQIRINERRNQVPPVRELRPIILRKSRSLLKEIGREERETLAKVAPRSRPMVQAADEPSDFPAETVSLVVTSPPFLDIVDYGGDNWLRNWFCGIDTTTFKITNLRKPEKWQAFVQATFTQLARILMPGGCIAFEVGEVRKGTVTLEHHVISAGIGAGLEPELVMINEQEFTKTANCWGVDNNSGGTNSNRIVLLRKPGGEARIAIPRKTAAQPNTSAEKADSQLTLF